MVDTKEEYWARQSLPRYRTFKQSVLKWQGELLDNIPVKNARHASVIIGDFFEEVTCQLFMNNNIKVKRLSLDGTCCPDLMETTKGEFFVEVKAHGPSGKRFIIYEDQLSGYDNLLATYWPKNEHWSWDPPLIFVLWVHEVPMVGKFEDRDSLRVALGANIKHCIILDFSTIQYANAVCRVVTKTSWAMANSPYFQLYKGQLELLVKGDWEGFLIDWDIQSEEGDYHFSKNVVEINNVYGITTKKVPIISFLKTKSLETNQLKSFIDRI